jgi:hypothetical protein
VREVNITNIRNNTTIINKATRQSAFGESAKANRPPAG